MGDTGAGKGWKVFGVSMIVLLIGAAIVGAYLIGADGSDEAATGTTTEDVSAPETTKPFVVVPPTASPPTTPRTTPRVTAPPVNSGDDGQLSKEEDSDFRMLLRQAGADPTILLISRDFAEYAGGVVCTWVSISNDASDALDSAVNEIFTLGDAQNPTQSQRQNTKILASVAATFMCVSQLVQLGS